LLSTNSNIPDLCDEIDLTSLRVYAPTPVIFLCGGQTRIENRPASSESLRDAFERVRLGGTLLRYQVRLAEEVIPFYPKGHYKDLLNFESHIAQICELILLFSESEGSLCELGAFSMEPEIARKMLTVVMRHYYDHQSFVRLGPIQSQINSYGQQAVHVLDDNSLRIRPRDVANIDLDLFATAMANAISARLQPHPKNPNGALEHTKFNKDRPGHVIKLIVGVIQHYGSLTMEELDLIICFMGISLSIEDLVNYLMCAKFVQWIDEDPVGSRVLFSARGGNKALSYNFKKDPKIFDRDRWTFDIRTYWEKHDNERFTHLVRSERT